MNATPIGWRVQIGTGVALAGMAVAACTVDVLNNREYGLSYCEEAATVLTIAAIGIVAIPAAAGVMGWCWLKRAATAMFLVATVVSAQYAYTTKQSKVANGARAASDRYEAAQANQKRSRETLNRIKETGDAGELARSPRTQTRRSRPIAAKNGPTRVSWRKRTRSWRATACRMPKAGTSRKRSWRTRRQKPRMVRVKTARFRCGSPGCLSR